MPGVSHGRARPRKTDHMMENHSSHLSVLSTQVDLRLYTGMQQMSTMVVRLRGLTI